MNHLELAQGRFISDKDRREKTNVCVLAAQTAEELFQYQDPIGQSVKIADRRYAVVGVTSAREASAAIGGSMSGQEYNKDIYIPLETMRVRMGDLDIDRRQGSFSAEEVELNQITLTISDVDQVVPTAGVRACRGLISRAMTIRWWYRRSC
jgi:putative ABC transport system permease protein